MSKHIGLSFEHFRVSPSVLQEAADGFVGDTCYMECKLTLALAF